jgi:CheY-like chemotaxis protein
MTNFSEAYPQGRRQLVLVVDDNEAVAVSLKLRLESFEREVLVVHDGPSALEAVAKRFPDVVLLDLSMPGMDGFEVATRLRSQYGLLTPRIVAVTGGLDADDHKLRAFDCLVAKPPTNAELDLAVRFHPDESGSRAV